MIYLPAVIASLSSVVTIVGLVIAILSLRANHDWNRRQFAAKMIEDWNVRTSPHRQAVERLKPGIIDAVKGGSPREITKQEATAIYCSTPDDKDLWALRFHFVELLNHFEFIAMCYQNNVADRRMLTESFKGACLNWHEVLTNFMHVYAQARGYTPWEPYRQLVLKWQAGEQRRDRPSTDRVFHRTGRSSHLTR